MLVGLVGWLVGCVAAASFDRSSVCGPRFSYSSSIFPQPHATTEMAPEERGSVPVASRSTLALVAVLI
uniref:Putative secreted protein n=1 Tax=Anopheles marajoara TaxID=58244 RepID=A0A2M4CF64_9DIPT